MHFLYLGCSVGCGVNTEPQRFLRTLLRHCQKQT